MTFLCIINEVPHVWFVLKNTSIYISDKLNGQQAARAVCLVEFSSDRPS